MPPTFLPLLRLGIRPAMSFANRIRRSPRSALCALVCLIGCASAARLAAGPTDVIAPAHFVVVDHRERFIIQLTDPAKIDAARKMMRGEIPTPGWIYGRLAEGDGGYNRDFGSNRRWTWHLEPDSIDFAEITAEALQTLPSFIEDDKTYWLGTMGACAMGGRIESEGLVFRPGQLITQTARSWVGSNHEVQVTGFVITGGATKTLLLRSGGPTLAALSVENALSDPILELRDAVSGQLIAANDNWSSDPAQAEAIETTVAELGALPWTRGSKDAALLVALPPGRYTAITRGVTGTAGFALTEVFHADEITRTRRVNLSVRSLAGPGEETLVGGFVISGVQEKTVLIRGLGPALAARGVGGVLTDPVIALFDESDHHEVASNDNWDDLGALDDGARNEIENISNAVGAPLLPRGSRDAALLVNLIPGTYTVTVRSADTTSGVALLELFEAPFVDSPK